jgi:hypothetical protein
MLIVEKAVKRDKMVRFIDSRPVKNFTRIAAYQEKAFAKIQKFLLKIILVLTK